MKENRMILKTILTLLMALSALGFLPPDAEHRSREFLEARQNQRAAYEERKVARRVRAEKMEKKYRREMQHPPWRRSEAAMAAAERGDVSRASLFKKEDRRGNWLLGLFGLLLIGGVAWWIKQMTREAEPSKLR